MSTEALTIDVPPLVERDVAGGGYRPQVVLVNADGTTLGKAEDAAHASGDLGVMALGVRAVANPAAHAGTAGDYSPILTDPNGRLFTNAALHDATGVAAEAFQAFTGFDSFRNEKSLMALAMGFKYNPTTNFAERVRNNQEGTLLASAARTAAVNSADVVNYDQRGLVVWIDLTVFGGAGSITVTIKGKDPVSGTYTTLLASAALAAVGMTVLTVYPGLTAAANLVANQIVPRTFRVEVTVPGATSHTYSVGYSLIS